MIGFTVTLLCCSAAVRSCCACACMSTAVVLAPFFVHLEILFRLGFSPSLQKDVHAGITEEIRKIKSAQGKKAA